MGDILTQEEINQLLSVAENDAESVAEGPSRELIEKLLALRGAREVLEESGEFEKWKKQRTRYVPSKKVLGKLMDLPGAKELREALKASRQKPAAPTPQKAPTPQIATAYDFKHPARVNKDQLRTLESLHDNFARLLSSTFSGAMRAVVDVNTAFVDQTTYAEFIMSLSNPSCSYQFTLGPTHGQAIMDFAMPVAFAFVDRIFGGKGSSEGIEARQLTNIEMGVINKIVKRAIEDLEATWEPILRVEISDVELETNPEFMQITAASEIVILLAFEVNSTNCSGLVSLCYPFFTLESILPRLGQQTYVRQGRLDKEESLRSNRARLGPVKVPLEVELGRTMLEVGELVNLKVGDVVSLDTRKNAPLVIHVGGRPKYYARPFATADGFASLQVLGKVPAALQQDYAG